VEYPDCDGHRVQTHPRKLPIAFLGVTLALLNGIEFTMEFVKEHHIRTALAACFLNLKLSLHKV
jgi:hypothetical protein